MKYRVENLIRSCCSISARNIDARHHAALADIEDAGLGVHGLQATAATAAPDHEADIAKVQGWLGHANISTTWIYNRRQNRL